MYRQTGSFKKKTRGFVKKAMKSSSYHQRTQGIADFFYLILLKNLTYVIIKRIIFLDITFRNVNFALIRNFSTAKKIRLTWL